MSINKVMITGNLTRDPELRATTNGTQILHFGVAVNDRRRNQQTGDWEGYPNFVDCVVFGNRAEPLSRFLGKGPRGGRRVQGLRGQERPSRVVSAGRGRERQ